MKDGSVILELQQATHVTLRVLAAKLAAHDLTPSETNVLANLADATPRTVTALGTATGTRPATMTGVLDRLERRGLISRSRRPGDRRAVTIAVTPDGARAAEQIRAAMSDLQKEALAGLPPEAIDAARTVLRALSEAGR